MFHTNNQVLLQILNRNEGIMQSVLSTFGISDTHSKYLDLLQIKDIKSMLMHPSGSIIH